MGPASPTGTIVIANNTFQNTGITGNADTRTTSGSTGYTGASGGRNVFFANSLVDGDRHILFTGINTQNFSNINLSFGTWSATADTRLTLEYSTNGVDYTDITFTAPTTASTWTLITLTDVTNLSGVENLRLRFKKTDATNYRIDDLVLTGTPTFPALTANPVALTNFKYVFGNGASTAQSFSVSGVNLNGGDVTVSVPGSSNFEISETENGTYGTSITLTAYNGAATAIFVRLKAGLAVNTYTDDITISGGGADPKTVALSGLVKEVIFLIYEFEGEVFTPTQAPSNAVTSPFQVSADELGFWNGASTWNTLNGSNIPTATSNTWNADNKADAKYFFYTINADSGYKIDLTNISFEFRSTGAGPSAVTVEINGVEITTVDTVADTNTVVTLPITIENQNSIEVRIKGWLNGSRTSAGSGNLRIDDVRLDGAVTTAPLSTDDFALSQISLYPNPVNNGVLNIISPTKERKEISLFDIRGRMVLKTITEENSINVSQLKTGLYLLNIDINGNRKTSKIIIN
jgi:hypothetical protein